MPIKFNVSSSSRNMDVLFSSEDTKIENKSTKTVSFNLVQPATLIHAMYCGGSSGITPIINNNDDIKRLNPSSNATGLNMQFVNLDAGNVTISYEIGTYTNAMVSLKIVN